MVRQCSRRAGCMRTVIRRRGVSRSILARQRLERSPPGFFVETGPWRSCVAQRNPNVLDFAPVTKATAPSPRRFTSRSSLLARSMMCMASALQMALNEILDVVNQDRSEAEIDEARAKRRTAVLLCERVG
jgi:hypothetical protein